MHHQESNRADIAGHESPASDSEEIAATLARLAPVPDRILDAVVSRDGHCISVDLLPRMRVDPYREDVDDLVAASQCCGCTVRLMCLELELRTSGPLTVGAWGGLSDTARRRLLTVRRGGTLGSPE